MTDQTLAFTNTPYSLAPAGRLKNIELLLTSSDNVPVPSAKLSLTLPANFAYADGGSGQRDFLTDDAGKVSVSGVKGVPAPGAYSLSATSGSETASTTVTVMGLGTVGSIPVGVNPQRIAVSPDGTRVYVCNYFGNTVSVIDTATSRFLTDIAVNDSPGGIVVSPDGARAYVYLNSETVVIDIATDRVLTSIKHGDAITGMALSPDGSRAYVCEYDGKVLVIDTATDRILTEIAVESIPAGIALSPDGTRAYVCISNSTVSVIDTTMV